METTETEFQVQKEKKEKKGAGFFAHFLNKLGLGGAAGEGAGVSVGSSAIGAAGGGGLAGGGILATKAGIVALIVAGTTVAAGIGVLGRSALSSKGGGISDGIYSLFPGKSGNSSAAQAGGAGAASGGVSSSLDYMSQAAKNDPFLNQEETASAEAVASASTPDPAAPGQVAAPDHSNAPANVSSARIGGKLQKMQGFANASSGGGGGASLSAAAPGGSDSRNQGASRVGGLVAMNRGMSSAGNSGRRALVGARGQRAGDQARFAKNDGMRALGNRNPSMAAAGRTFDGAAGGGLQSSAAGAPSAQDGGGVDNGSRDRFTPNKTLDTRELPPVKKAEGEQDATPYKTQMWIAIGALAVGALALFLLGTLKPKVEEAKQEIIAAAAAEPFAAPALAAAVAKLNGLITWAKVLAGIATAAGVLAAVMGIMMFTQYDQKMQGGIFTAIGALLTLQAGTKLLALFNAKPLDEKSLMEGPDPLDNAAITQAVTPIADGITKALTASFGI